MLPWLGRWTNGMTPQRWLLAGLTLLLLVVGAQYVAKSGEDRSAFNRWRRQVRELVQGEDVYQKYLYPNAPIMGLILYPLAEMPRVEAGPVTFDLGALSWFAAKVAMAVLAVCWTVQLVQQPGRPFPFAGQVLMIVLCLRPIVGDLSHGNVNLLILFLVIAALFALRQGWDLSAGLLLALAITCKVTPALFVPYLIWKRAWRALAGCAIGLVLFFALIPGSLLGYAHTARITQTWIEKMILPFTVQGEVTTEHHNQSLVGLLYRLGTESPSFYDEDEQPVAYHNVASLAPETVRLLVKGLGVAFLLLLFWSSRSPMAPRERTRLTAEFALVLLGMLLFSERTWKHHCVTLLLPVGLLCYIATAWPVSRRTRHLIFAVLGAATLIMATTSTSLTAGLGLGKEAAKLAQVYGAYVWAELLLLGTIAVLIHGVLARSEAAAPDHAGKPRLGQAA